MRFPRRSILFSFVGILVLVAASGGLWYTNSLPFAPRLAAFHGIQMNPPEAAPAFTLETAGNKQVSLSDFKGKVVLLYFGYTFCPDVCPTTLSNLSTVMKDLGTKANNVQVVMITVDPKRDTPQVISQYVKRFDPNFVGLSGTLDQISPIAANYAISFHDVPASSADGGYLVDHTPVVTVIDKKGNRRLIEDFGTTDKQFESDIRRLLSE